MPGKDPGKTPLKGSRLPSTIVQKLARVKISNPDAPGFSPKGEEITLVRHLQWAIKASQKNAHLHLRGNEVNVQGLADTLSLSREDANEILHFLNQSFGITYFQTYSY
jgi:hypothetical protein